MRRGTKVPSWGLPRDGQYSLGNKGSRVKRAGKIISMQDSPRAPLLYHTLSKEHLLEPYLENGALGLCNTVALDKRKTLASAFEAKQH